MRHLLVVCRHGMVRSNYLARYLRSRGFQAQFGGVEPGAANPISHSLIQWADVIISVRPPITDLLKKHFVVQHKEIIQLNVHDNPQHHPEQAQTLFRKNYKAFRERYVFGELRRQIAPYLYKFKKAEKIAQRAA